ncbi:hypothetical protein TNCT_488521 [Trichonephila clavata]|uniref:Uncharacterized protein n=1 Tax=Trichonephila clavata TaxID=2740835 RepID=A0A8X6LMC8_TRICU|nr:hypothetical protein TNCT_488521 [Trichonephila clavata]
MFREGPPPDVASERLRSKKHIFGIHLTRPSEKCTDRVDLCGNIGITGEKRRKKKRYFEGTRGAPFEARAPKIESRAGLDRNLPRVRIRGETGAGSVVTGGPLDTGPLGRWSPNEDWSCSTQIALSNGV